MHMADALVSAPVAITAGVAAAALIVTASRQVSRIRRDDILPLMGVMGAFVFAAQMINFSIPARVPAAILSAASCLRHLWDRGRFHNTCLRIDNTVSGVR